MTPDEAKCIGTAIAICGAIAAIVCFICFKSRDHAIDVRSIQWVYTVYIDEYRVSHRTDQKSYPSNAYNVKDHTHPVKKTLRDDNGNEYTLTETEIIYDYDINEWVRTREVLNAGTNRTPSFKEFTLKDSTREDGIGAEREAYRSREYYANGPFHNAPEDSPQQHIPITEDIWDKIHIGDELLYSERKVGGIYNVRIAQ